MYSLYELMRVSCGVVVVVRLVRRTAAIVRVYCGIGGLGEMGSVIKSPYDEICVQLSNRLKQRAQYSDTAVHRPSASAKPILTCISIL